MEFTLTAHRLSPLHDLLNAISERAHWGQLAGMPVPLDFGDPEAEAIQARTLALADVSARPLTVVKGPGAEAFLAGFGVVIPAEVLGVSLAGSFIARTGASEFFLEATPPLGDALKTAGPGAYGVVRQDVSLLLVGSRVGEVLREACSFDFTGDPQQDKLVMTRVAGVSCSVLPRSLGGIAGYQLWTDGTFGPYLWETLIEIARELGGTPVGLSAVEPELATVARDAQREQA